MNRPSKSIIFIVVIALITLIVTQSIARQSSSETTTPFHCHCHSPPPPPPLLKPPKEAIDACKNKNIKAPCTTMTPFGEESGKCYTIIEDTACVPDSLLNYDHHKHNKYPKKP